VEPSLQVVDETLWESFTDSNARCIADLEFSLELSLVFSVDPTSEVDLTGASASETERDPAGDMPSELNRLTSSS
jgi:hypothetical protein